MPPCNTSALNPSPSNQAILNQDVRKAKQVMKHELANIDLDGDVVCLDGSQELPTQWAKDLKEKRHITELHNRNAALSTLSGSNKSIQLQSVDEDEDSNNTYTSEEKESEQDQEVPDVQVEKDVDTELEQESDD
eukprot:Awhi_evm1s11555